MRQRRSLNGAALHSPRIRAPKRCRDFFPLDVVTATGYGIVGSPVSGGGKVAR